MRNKRVFLGLLLVIALMAFAGCSSTDDVNTVDPNAQKSVTDSNGDGMYDNNMNNDLGNDVDRIVDKTDRAVEDMVTDGAVNDHNNNNL